MPRTKKNRFTPEEAERLLEEVYSVSPEFRIILARVFCRLPKEIVDWATKNIVFVSSSGEYLAFWGPLTDLSDKKGFIFLSQYLKHEDDESFSFIIAQEIAHAQLNHKSPLFTRMPRADQRKQEQDAEDLAKKWLKEI